MRKWEKHKKAQEFRIRIASNLQRQHIVNELVSKASLDEMDRLRITMLLKKATYILSCEEGYSKLLRKIKKCGDPGLIEKAEAFSIKTKKLK